jgi:hypothetical protein
MISSFCLQFIIFLCLWPFFKKTSGALTLYDKLICYHGPKSKKSTFLKVPISRKWKKHEGGDIMKRLICAMGIFILSAFPWDISSAEDLGRLSANPYDPESTSNPFGAGSPYRADSVNNQFGPYGSPFSPKSATNPYATDAPKLYDNEGNYRGRLSTNQFDPDSISNQFGRYGSPFSPESINNHFGAGNPYSADSPNNPYGKGWRIEGAD